MKVMSKFIPQYQAQTPQEQGILEQKFLRFVKHVSLENAVFFGDSQDCKVNVSQRDEATYIEPADYWQQTKQGSIITSSTGSDGSRAEIGVKYTTQREYNSGVLRVSHYQEITINKDRYIVPLFRPVLA